MVNDWLLLHFALFHEDQRVKLYGCLQCVTVQGACGIVLIFIFTLTLENFTSRSGQRKSSVIAVFAQPVFAMAKEKM